MKPIPERVQKLEDASLQNAAEHKLIMEMLKPISETYTTVGLLSKWITAVMVFISIVVGIISQWSKVIKLFGK